MLTAPSRLCLSISFIALLICTSTLALAQAGQLDPTFANGGIFGTTNNLSSASEVAIQNDGKLVVAGAGVQNGNVVTDMLFRLNTDGTLDSTFGKGGVVSLLPGGEVQNAFGFFGLGIQSDGKIVAAAAGGSGVLGSVMQVARVDASGNLDPTFGTGGFSDPVVFSTGGGNLALQPDGKILVAAGVTNPNNTPSEMARFTSSGQLDGSFSGGIVNLAYAGPTQIAVQANGKILVASGQPSRLVFQATPAAQPGSTTRYNPNGTVDATFGSSGTISSPTSASALPLQSDGKVVIAGTLTSKVNAAGTANDLGFGIARYTLNGTPDRTFGRGGIVVLDLGVNGPTSGAFAVAIDSNGDLVVGGAAAGVISQNKVTSVFGLARFTSGGVLDKTFGSGGTVLTAVASNQYSWIDGLMIQSDGRIIAVGTSQFSNFNDNAFVTRYLAQ